ncbi:probable arginine--tRNA ligase, mitochondrial isoform X2 [Physella acuta]|uniref:probable arginine--tRNA ligase, mitochondrial isoform X2 n=1 Tax=Physella acuta TaxID=109671 RepID=UPI0027DADB2F|nr:probable arginine--tRNA ligase, mitochondrial isoform X2 [Physella acuta]
MSGYYKRYISKKILNCVQGKLERKLPDTQPLENVVEKLVKVQLGQKNLSSGVQFSVGIQSLSSVLQGTSLDLDLSKAQAEGIHVQNGSLQFHVETNQLIQRLLTEIRTHPSQYGHTLQSGGKKQHICVEFSSPNIAKPFHVGHMRSTILGNVLSNLYEASGQDVKRINWIGDWGTQFGLLALGLTRYGNINMLKQDPLLELFNVYVKINQTVRSECGTAPESTSPTYQEGMALFTQLEQGEESMRDVWTMVKRLSLAELDKMYQRLGVHFTHTLAESDYHAQTSQVLARLAQANLLQYDDDGVGHVKMDNSGLGRASLVKSDGSSLYLTRDVASALERQEIFSFDRVHYVVEQGQRSHFKKLVHILEKLGVSWAQRPIDDIHVCFGRVKGMSTRAGTVVFLRDVLDEARARVLASMKSKATTKVESDLETTADVLGVTSIILQDLKAHRTNDYTFSWDRMLNFKADSGVFVQYCHARLCSMISNCGVDR